ncbi:hypothetical protein BDR26DRAFT_852228 [Obelidium mucronatum]|nr:hypothetical protein BDR26DRAFT_852228 [Obelidium mucronatum]
MQIIKLSVLFLISIASTQAAVPRRAPGRRELACGTGLTMCTVSNGQACVDTKSSEKHCGGCGSFCPGHCLDGVCTSLMKQNHF